MAAPADPQIVHSAYDLIKDFQPGIAALVALLAAILAFSSAQFVVWRQNDAAKKAVDEKLASERRTEDRLARQNQLAFLIMLHQELASLRVMVNDRSLLLAHFAKLAASASNGILVMTHDVAMRVRLEGLCALSDLTSVMRNGWQDLAILEPALQIIYQEAFNSIHIAEKEAEKVRVALEKSGMVSVDEMSRVLGFLRDVIAGLDKSVPHIEEALKKQIKAGASDYARPTYAREAKAAAADRG